jgi:HSP20 family molecular chaperone IbpA
MHVRTDERLADRRTGVSDWSDHLPSSGFVLYGVPMVIVSRRAWVPPTDVYETEEAVVVQLEIPGVRQDDLEISLNERSLVVSGRRVDPLLSEKTAYHRMEIQYGDFETEVCLPAALPQNEVEATYHDGFLTIRFPKARAHRVSVSAE